MAGADASQGPGWWQASDGKWYPPEQRPAPQPTPQPSAPPTAPSTAPASHPGPAPGVPGGPDDPLQGAADGSFFSRLFDTTFRRFITPSIVKVLFILGIVVISLVSLAVLFAGLASFGDGGVVLVLLAPIYWLLGVIYTRVLLEVIMVLFRIEANTRSNR